MNIFDLFLLLFSKTIIFLIVGINSVAIEVWSIKDVIWHNNLRSVRVGIDSFLLPDGFSEHWYSEQFIWHLPELRFKRFQIGDLVREQFLISAKKVSINMGLEDYKDIVGTSAMISTMGHMLSGTWVQINWIEWMTIRINSNVNKWGNK